jgi:hypothetical protein
LAPLEDDTIKGFFAIIFEKVQKIISDGINNKNFCYIYISK